MFRNFRASIFITFLLLYSFLSAQEKESFIGQSIKAIKIEKDTLMLDMNYVSRATISYGLTCNIYLYYKNDSLVLDLFTGSYGRNCKSRYVSKEASDSVMKEIIRLEYNYDKDGTKYEGWVSYWSIRILKQKDKNKHSNKNFKDIRCFKRELDVFLERIQPGLSKVWDEI